MKMWKMVLAALVVVSTAWANEPAAPGQTPDPAVALQQQIKTLLLEREQRVAEMDAQYPTLAPHERTAFDVAYSNLIESYEIQVLGLMVEYYDLTGNVELRQRAEESLAQLAAGPVTGTPLSTSRDRAGQDVQEVR